MLRHATFALTGCLLLGACVAPTPGARLLPPTPLEQHVMRVEPAADEIQLAPHGQLSAQQRSAIGSLVLRWRDVGEGPLVVQAGSGAHTAETAQSVSAALQAFGVPAGAIRLAELPGEPGAPVKVGFQRYVAVTPQCGTLWNNITRTASNGPYATFGCAVTANMAAQIADPRDLVAPNPTAPADSRRRIMKMNSFNKGEEPVRETAGGSR